MERSRAALIATTPVRVSERAPEPGRARPGPAPRRDATRRDAREKAARRRETLARAWPGFTARLSNRQHCDMKIFTHVKIR